MEGFLEGPDYSDGRMEDAHGPASGGLNKVSEDLQGDVCGGDKPTGAWMCPLGEGRLWQDQKPGGGSCVLTWLQSPYNGDRQTEM